jgi:hypothetical protein
MLLGAGGWWRLRRLRRRPRQQQLQALLVATWLVAFLSGGEQLALEINVGSDGGGEGRLEWSTPVKRPGDLLETATRRSRQKILVTRPPCLFMHIFCYFLDCLMPHAILHAMGVFAASNTYMRIRERDNNHIS